MEQLRKSLSEKEDLAQEEALIKETQARQALQEQLREQQDQHREETDRLLRYSSNFIIITKGQLISKCPYEKSVSSKIPMKIFLDFCPEIFCSFLGASW